jgi:hypothetical protein
LHSYKRVECWGDLDEQHPKRDSQPDDDPLNESTAGFGKKLR